jgi:cytochrome c
MKLARFDSDLISDKNGEIVRYSDVEPIFELLEEAVGLLYRTEFGNKMFCFECTGHVDRGHKDGCPFMGFKVKYSKYKALEGK